jgi:hypothetical protein
MNDHHASTVSEQTQPTGFVLLIKVLHSLACCNCLVLASVAFTCQLV